ncbi:serine/threonine protein kinase [Nostoc sp. NIES-2111]|nr:serine/threonine protein kinase [Nostoc sp. NIES-2111]
MNKPHQSEVKGDWQAGDKLYKGKYSIEKKLGCGGFGVTYLARDKKSQSVVIKTLNQDIQFHPYFEKLRQDFFNEAIRLAKCSHHPHIVQIIELFEEQTLPCIVMEYIPGEDLAAWVEQKIMPQAEAIYYIRQIAQALDAVHQQGLLHRDVKPHNIMITSDRTKAVLIDFGIAREYQQDKSTNHTTFISEGYSPIEQHYSTEIQAAYTDVYSLAATLYFALTGESPANAQRRHYNLVEYKIDPLVAPQQLNPEISGQVNTAILKGMAVNPENRTQTIKAWLELLPEINHLPEINRKNHAYSSQITQTSLAIKPPLHKIPAPQPRRGYISSLRSYLAIGLLIPALIYFVINDDIYKNYISSISVKEQGLVYKNSEYGFSLKYARDWVLSAKESPDFTRTVAELVSPNSLNGYQGKIFIEVRDLKSSQSLAQVQQETIKDIQKWFANSEILENRETTLGGSKAYLLVYQGRDDIQSGVAHRHKLSSRMRVATVKNNREYALTYEADISDYALQKHSAQKIIDSFAWLN